MAAFDEHTHTRKAIGFTRESRLGVTTSYALGTVGSDRSAGSARVISVCASARSFRLTSKPLLKKVGAPAVDTTACPAAPEKRRACRHDSVAFPAASFLATLVTSLVTHELSALAPRLLSHLSSRAWSNLVTSLLARWSIWLFLFLCIVTSLVRLMPLVRFLATASLVTSLFFPCPCRVSRNNVSCHIYRHVADVPWQVS